MLIYRGGEGQISGDNINANKGEQMVRYYGYYSNVSRGKRQKENQDGLIPCILEPEENSKAYPKNWARLIQKIY